MTDTTATFYDVTTFDGRMSPLGECRRVIRFLVGGIVVGFGTVAAACALVTTVTVAAVWIANTTLATNPNLHAKPFGGPGTLALANGDPALARAADMVFEAKWARASAGAVPLVPHPLETPDDRGRQEIAEAPQPTHIAKLTLAAAAAATPANSRLLPPKLTPQRADSVPLPPPRPARHEIARSSVGQAVPQLAAATPSAAATSEKRDPPQQAHNKSMPLPDSDSRTAVYDLSARTVYLPNGEKLEAHSGLGDKLDDPQYVRVRMRGPT